MCSGGGGRIESCLPSFVDGVAFGDPWLSLQKRHGSVSRASCRVPMSHIAAKASPRRSLWPLLQPHGPWPPRGAGGDRSTLLWLGPSWLPVAVPGVQFSAGAALLCHTMSERHRQLCASATCRKKGTKTCWALTPVPAEALAGPEPQQSLCYAQEVAAGGSWAAWAGTGGEEAGDSVLSPDNDMINHAAK